MEKATETKYIAKNNNEVVLNLNNTQKNDRPSKYFLFDADICSDIATALNKKTAKVEELLQEVFKRGLETLKIDDKSLNVDDYNFSTSSMKKNIRNVGIHTQQQALYKAMFEEKEATAKADNTKVDINKDLLNYISEQRKQNVSYDDIKKTLLINNWTELQINSHFIAIGDNKKPVIPTIPTTTIPNVIVETL